MLASEASLHVTDLGKVSILYMYVCIRTSVNTYIYVILLNETRYLWLVTTMEGINSSGESCSELDLIMSLQLQAHLLLKQCTWN